MNSLSTTVAALLLSPMLAFAQANYASRPIKLIVTFPPGGINDVVARVVADRLSKSLKQPAIVENRAGASGLIGTKAAAGAPADGYTLLVGTASVLAAGIALDSTYTMLEDFAPISLLADTTIALVSHPSVPARTVREFIAFAKANPGKLNAAVPGTGTLQHLLTEAFKKRAEIDVLSVNYNGGPPAVADVVSGQDHISFVNLPTVRTLVQAGRLNALAVAGTSRSEVMPTVPTLEESGFPGLTASPWNALLVPVRTPREIVNRLGREVIGMMNATDTKQFLNEQGANALSSTPEETHAFISDETLKWAKVIKEAGIKIN